MRQAYIPCQGHADVLFIWADHQKKTQWSLVPRDQLVHQLETDDGGGSHHHVLLVLHHFSHRLFDTFLITRHHHLPHQLFDSVLPSHLREHDIQRQRRRGHQERPPKGAQKIAPGENHDREVVAYTLLWADPIPHPCAHPQPQTRCSRFCPYQKPGVSPTSPAPKIDRELVKQGLAKKLFTQDAIVKKRKEDMKQYLKDWRARRNAKETAEERKARAEYHKEKGTQHREKHNKNDTDQERRKKLKKKAEAEQKRRDRIKANETEAQAKQRRAKLTAASKASRAKRMEKETEEEKEDRLKHRRQPDSLRRARDEEGLAATSKATGPGKKVSKVKKMREAM
ncbi:hypothetical protein BDZ90DRAFT_184429 [Jaminaea rosea]|uniref:Uncharacterized protein n=1 Tax=Jaminaea rosea TaxID=1569628 RepID=A0A316UP41_9BASI|nr:hypothetical protein BDZ90DRAFT_184429 [Jaminaea rosea]PWN27049.1 hypothetical protein BDZ90DRAFT_184429 [Jaminaea rosea]